MLGQLIRETLNEMRPMTTIPPASPVEESGHGIARGESLFNGTDYPRTWDGFIGQEKAKRRLQAAVLSAQARRTRLDHTLLASGRAGIGKTTLATLTAYQMGAGLVQTTGPLSMDDALGMILGMRDGDVLFIDEIHLLTAGGKNKADWLLPYMTEGKFYTDRGAVEVPDVTIMGATTDAGKLSEALLSRFMVKPDLRGYTVEEGVGIAFNLAERMGVDLGGSEEYASQVARAADYAPRAMREILTAVRDLSYTSPMTHPNMEEALEWAGLTEDGLTTLEIRVMEALLNSSNHTASIDAIRQRLNEPGPITHAEQTLLQRGYMERSSRGRVLTPSGIVRITR